uniref:Uncharacterized protein n=1 Tax=Romanomermis culicivorax TaxID=13658 RepID=A0A915JE18_ROMCU
MVFGWQSANGGNYPLRPATSEGGRSEQLSFDSIGSKFYQYDVRIDRDFPKYEQNEISIKNQSALGKNVKSAKKITHGASNVVQMIDGDDKG